MFAPKSRASPYIAMGCDSEGKYLVRLHVTNRYQNIPSACGARAVFANVAGLVKRSHLSAKIMGTETVPKRLIRVRSCPSVYERVCRFMNASAIPIAISRSLRWIKSRQKTRARVSIHLPHQASKASLQGHYLHHRFEILEPLLPPPRMRGPSEGTGGPLS